MRYNILFLINMLLVIPTIRAQVIALENLTGKDLEIIETKTVDGKLVYKKHLLVQPFHIPPERSFRNQSFTVGFPQAKESYQQIPASYLARWEGQCDVILLSFTPSHIKNQFNSSIECLTRTKKSKHQQQ